MSPARQFGAECLVAVSICGGAYFFLVDPIRAQFHQVVAEIRRVSTVPPATPGAAITAEDARNILEQVQRQTGLIDRRSAVARDESALFASMMALAAAHDIRVDGLTPVGTGAGEPTKSRRSSSEPAVAPPPPPPPGVELPEPPPVDTRLEFSMSTVSHYLDLIRFVDALQSSSGYTVIKSVKVEPADDAAPDRVRATIETVHLAFDTSRVVVARKPEGAP